MPKNVDQSSLVSRKLGPKFKIWSPNNFFVFELWSTIFGGLVALPEGFLTIPKYMDQSSVVSRKSGPKFKIWSLNNFFVSEHRPTKFWWLVVVPEGFPKTSKYVDQSSPMSRKSESSSKFDLHNFLVFVLWPTIFGCLVFLLEGFPTMPNYVDQSSQVLRKSGPKFKIWSLNNFFVSELWPTKFGLETLSVLPSKYTKFYVKIPNSFRDTIDQSSPVSRKLCHRQNLIHHNFFVFVLWPTIFGWLVVLHECLPTVPKDVDQSSPVSRKLGPKFKFWPPISALPRGFWGKFCHRTIGGLCLSSKIGDLAPSPNFWGIFSEFWCFDLAKLHANATHRQNFYLRSEFTRSAKFLALGITPLDSDRAERDVMKTDYCL